MPEELTYLQHYYTSVPRKCGLENIDGFQTVAVSEGIEREEIRTIEERAIYPFVYGIQGECPVKFAFYRLPSGRFAATRSVYAGRDFSGRDGNFFAHTVVLERLPGSIPPVLLLYLDIWEEKFDCKKRGSLPEGRVAVSLLERMRERELAELRNFLRGREKTAALLLNGVCERLTGRVRVPVVICGSPQNVARWIFLIYEAFPSKLLTSMSFSTFEGDCYSSGRFDVVGSPAGESSILNSTGEGEYGEFVVEMMLENPAYLKRLLEELDGADLTGEEFSYACRLASQEALKKTLLTEVPDRFRPFLRARLSRLSRSSVDELVSFNFRSVPVEELDALFNLLADLDPSYGRPSGAGVVPSGRRPQGPFSREEQEQDSGSAGRCLYR